MPGYQDEDIKYRLLQFAKDSTPGHGFGTQQPSVFLHSGSFLPNSSERSEDKSSAKIANCSVKDKELNWGQMNDCNIKRMKEKLKSGRVCRNIEGRKDSSRAMEERQKGKAAASAFCQNQEVGSMVCIWNHRNAHVSANNNGAARPAQQTSPPASSSNPASATPSKAAPAKPAAKVPEPEKFASGLGRSPIPKAAPSTTTSRDTTANLVPRAKPQPRTPVVLHVYSVGLAHLLEGH